MNTSAIQELWCKYLNLRNNHPYMFNKDSVVKMAYLQSES